MPEPLTPEQVERTIYRAERVGRCFKAANGWGDIAELVDYTLALAADWNRLHQQRTLSAEQQQRVQEIRERHEESKAEAAADGYRLWQEELDIDFLLGLVEGRVE